MPVRYGRARAKRRAPPSLGNVVAQDVRFAEHNVNQGVDHERTVSLSWFSVLLPFSQGSPFTFGERAQMKREWLCHSRFIVVRFRTTMKNAPGLVHARGARIETAQGRLIGGALKLQCCSTAGENPTPPKVIYARA